MLWRNHSLWVLWVSSSSACFGAYAYSPNPIRRQTYRFLLSEVLAGFKIACLNYTAGPVEYRQRMYSRPDLLGMQSKLVDQAYDRMQRAAM